MNNNNNQTEQPSREGKENSKSRKRRKVFYVKIFCSLIYKQNQYINISNKEEEEEEGAKGEMEISEVRFQRKLCRF